MERGHTLYFPAKPEKENRNFCIFNWGKIVMSLSKRSQLNRRESLGKALIKLWVLLKKITTNPLDRDYDDDFDDVAKRG